MIDPLDPLDPLSTEARIVTIVCRMPGMRRRGVVHPASETYPAHRWTLGDLDAFRADPAFQVFIDPAAVAPGADTADAVQDNGAGPPVPDLGAKPDGTGPSAAVLAPGGDFRPPVFDENRIAAIIGDADRLGAILARVEKNIGDAIVFDALPDDLWADIETVIGFRPTTPEMVEVERRLRQSLPPIAETIETEGDTSAPRKRAKPVKDEPPPAA